MQDFTLRFESPELKFGILGNATPSEAEIEGWNLRETYVPNAHVDIAKDVGSYRLIVERNVTQDDDVNKHNTTGVALIERIELLWAFAAALPLRSRGFGLELTIIEPPQGWSSNTNKVDRAIQADIQQVTCSFRIVSRHWRYASAFPLQRLIPLLNAYGALDDEVVRELINLHYAAHMSSSSHGQVVLFAKALEITRKLLPGRDDIERGRILPPEVQSALSRPLHDLYDLSNNRRETRHAVSKKASVTVLHPPMSTEERSAFKRDASMVINFVVCNKLGLEPCLWRTNNSHNTGVS